MANKFTKKTPSSAKQITKAKPKRKASTKCTRVKSTAKNKNKVKRNALHRLGGEYAVATQEETKKPSKKTTKTKAKTKHKSTTKVGQAKRVEKHFDKKSSIDESNNWGESPLTGDEARFNKFLNMLDKDLGTDELRNELKSIGLNEDGISAVWNTDSLYGSDKKEMGQDLMSIFNEPKYRL